MNTTINYKKEFSQESRFVLVIVYYRGLPVCLRGGGGPFTNQDQTLCETRHYTTESIESSSSRGSTALARGRDALDRNVPMGFEDRLRGQRERGELRDSLKESRTGSSGYLGDDQGADPSTYWSQGSRGHDGMTFSDEEREDWRISLEDMAGEAERADWRRSLDDMVRWEL